MQQAAQTQQDIRDLIFASISRRLYTAYITTERAGVVAGLARLADQLSALGVTAETMNADGDTVSAGATVAKLTGTPKQLAVAEEVAIGLLAKPSGIATAARQAVELAGPELKIVCGAWKKMPPEIKWIVREAVSAGQASFRIDDRPFLYLDKNFVHMLGGVETTLATVASMDDKIKCIQLKGRSAPIAAEALAAARGGADILMIDTGSLADVAAVNSALAGTGLRGKVKIAFAQGIRLEDIPALRDKGIDILDIGVSIIDAPLLDMKLDVWEEAAPCS
jgi:nicotinate-nucleotide pyrophosphorylase (carboxylating)